MFRNTVVCQIHLPSKPYELLGPGAMDATEPYKFIGFGDIHGPDPFRFMGCRWAFTSQTPVVLPGWNSGVRAGFRPDSFKENIKIGPPVVGKPEGRF